MGFKCGISYHSFQDEESEMRHRFFGKLNKHLMALQLHVEYMGLFALVPLYEDADFQNKMRVLVDANITKRRKYLGRSEMKGKLTCYFWCCHFWHIKKNSKLART